MPLDDPVAHRPPPPIPPADARAALARVLQSASFVHSPQLQRLLTFLVEQVLTGEAARLKEYVIGLEVFARPASFDPRVDSLVRVEARRLRAALASYYLGEGRHDPIVIELQKGRYVPAFRAVPPGSPAGERQPAVDTPRAPSLPGGGAASAAMLPRLRPAAVVLVVATVAAIMAAAAWSLRARPVRGLTDRDAVVLAGFTNSSHEPIFDETLKQGLATELEQSPFLNLVSERRLEQVLKLMGRSRSDRLNRDQVRDLCVRAGAKASIVGSIDRLGSQYIVGLTATDCATGDDFAHVQEQAGRKEDVLRALSAAARAMRGRLGESLASIKRFGVTVEEATTSSLEALQAYSLGRSTAREKGSPADTPFYQRAIEIDPEFAAAHAALGVSYVNQGQPSLAQAHLEQAYRRRDRVSERERYRVSAYYFQAVTGEVEKAAEIYELWKRTYPREFAPHANLALGHLWFGEYERALLEMREAQRTEPDSILGYTNLAAILIKLGRPDEAQAVIDQAEARHLSSRFLRLNQCYLAFLRNDASLLERQLAQVSDNPGDESALLSLASDTEAYFGRVETARALTARAVSAATRAGGRESAATWLLNGALREAELGHRAAAGRMALEALDLSHGRDTVTLAALASARAGDLQRAGQLAARLQSDYPRNSSIAKYWLPTIRAAILYGRNDASAALRALDEVAPFELGSPPPFGLATLYPVYLRGLANLRLRQPTPAATAFQRILDRPGLVLNSPLHALSRLQLARAYRLSGDAPASRRAYDDFLALWKDANQTLPILKQARTERRSLRQAPSPSFHR